MVLYTMEVETNLQNCVAHLEMQMRNSTLLFWSNENRCSIFQLFVHISSQIHSNPSLLVINIEHVDVFESTGFEIPLLRREVDVLDHCQLVLYKMPFPSVFPIDF
jgi:hypothetical protein